VCSINRTLAFWVLFTELDYLESFVVDDLARLVGERLRAARQEHGLSLGALAEAAHVGKGSLSEIENGARNPTLGTLYALAGALGVPLATLIADRPGVRVASPGIEARLLDVSHDAGHDEGPGGGQTVEVYRLRLEPGRMHRSPAHGPGVVEHMLVTSGRARVGRLGEETEIGPDQAARWASDVPHGYAALGASPVESVLVIRSPEPRG
jgi:transcriptional regulator with XRE-family HTH domain